MRYPIIYSRIIMTSCACAAALVLSACSGGGSQDDSLNESELGNVDVLEGSISDDMIQPDLERAPVPDPAAAEAGQDATTSDQPATTSASEPAETTVEAGETDE